MNFLKDCFKIWSKWFIANFIIGFIMMIVGVIFHAIIMNFIIKAILK